MAKKSKKKKDVKKQLMDLWKKTINQLEDISVSLLKSSGLDKIKFKSVKILAERDKLLKRLGEETFRLIDQGKMAVPKPINELYGKISKLMDRLWGKKTKKKTAKKRKTTKKTTRKKTAKKKTAKKSAKR